MTRSNIVNYTLFGLAYIAIWVVLLAPQTVSSAFGTAPRGAISAASISASK